MAGDIQQNKDISLLVPVADWKNKLDMVKNSKTMHRRITKVATAFLAMPLPEVGSRVG